MVACVQLHVCCGLELAIDSFGFRFFKDMPSPPPLHLPPPPNGLASALFAGSATIKSSSVALKDMDLEEALDEWNMLQATLRQVAG